jgi:hypothetical protein
VSNVALLSAPLRILRQRRKGAREFRLSLLARHERERVGERGDLIRTFIFPSIPTPAIGCNFKYLLSPPSPPSFLGKRGSGNSPKIAFTLTGTNTAGSPFSTTARSPNRDSNARVICRAVKGENDVHVTELRGDAMIVGIQSGWKSDSLRLIGIPVPFRYEQPGISILKNDTHI